jgi:bis(5'-nucleosyl)-tetraphosphatase (symmetrical)
MLIVGHWASLMGRANRSDIFALDTGCVWGQHLTLLNLETRRTRQCECGE